MKNKMKKIVKLNENQLQMIIKESVNKIINENVNEYDWSQFGRAKKRINNQTKKEILPNGLHKLSAIGFTSLYNNYDDINIDIDVFKIDGVLYGAYIDPDDGYRSYGKIDVLSDKCTNKQIYNFPEQDVYTEWITTREEDDENENSSSRFLTIRDANTMKIVLEVGTDYTDDYYPTAIFRYYPQNLSINNNNNNNEVIPNTNKEPRVTGKPWKKGIFKNDELNNTRTQRIPRVPRIQQIRGIKKDNYKTENNSLN